MSSQIPLKAPIVCLSASQLMSITSRERGERREWEKREERRTGARGRRIRNTSLGFLLLQGGEQLSLWQSPWTDYLSISAWWICNFPEFLSSSAIHAYTITKTRVQAVSCVCPMVVRHWWWQIGCSFAQLMAQKPQCLMQCHPMRHSHKIGGKKLAEKWIIYSPTQFQNKNISF